MLSTTVYILRCADGSLYIGSTDDLRRRVLRHNEGRGCEFTGKRRPVVVAWHEEHATEEAARKRELQIKRWCRAKKEALIAGDVALLKSLARCRTRLAHPA